MSYEEKLADAMKRLGVDAPKGKRAQPEAELQKALIASVRNVKTGAPGLLGMRYPELMDLHAVINAGSYLNARQGAQLKAQGVLRGVWDLFLPVPRWSDPSLEETQYHGLYLESKAPGGRLTTEQKAFGQRRVEQGYACATYETLEEGQKLLIDYMEGRWVQGEL